MKPSKVVRYNDAQLPLLVVPRRLEVTVLLQVSKVVPGRCLSSGVGYPAEKGTMSRPTLH